MNGEGVLLPQFHLRPDEELVIGLDTDPSDGKWSLRIELLLRVGSHRVHRYGPVWLEPDSVEGADPDSLEQVIRETLASQGFEEETVIAEENG